MSFSSRPLSAVEQHNLIASANAAVVRFVNLFSDKLGNKRFFSREDIEDMAGDTIMKACRSIDRYDPEKAKMSTWVGRIAVNTVKDAINYKMKRLPISGSMYVASRDEGGEIDANEYILDPMVLNTMSENSADCLVLQSELKSRIFQEVSKMSDKRQRVARMLDGGYTIKEMAKAEDCTSRAVSKCIWDIREALRFALVEWAADSGRCAC